MRTSKYIAISSLISLAFGCAGARPTPSSSGPAATAMPSPTSTVAPLPAKPAQQATLASVGLDESTLDRKADPCQDFYRFACGGWIDKTEIPGDKARWVRSFNVIDERNEADLHVILDAAALAKSAEPSTRKLGDYFGACMDEAAVEKLGGKPLEAPLAKVKKSKSVAALLKVVIELHRHGAFPLFELSAEQDFKDATRYIGYLDQGGLGLPDRDYYVKDDDKSKELRTKYLAHVERMLRLAGYAEKPAKEAADAVMLVETALAQASKTKVERRDPASLYNKLDRAGIEKATPHFPWQAYFEALGFPGIVDINVTAPKFFEALDGLLDAGKLPELRAYVSWHIVRSMAPSLSKAFVDEAFSMEQALTGQKEQRARWKRCIDSTDSALGELLAQDFVKQRFPPESKQAALGMVREVGQAFARELASLTWMDDPTRKAAAEKMTTMAYLIGYPDTWRAYDFSIDRGKYADNVAAANAFELHRKLARIGKPVDRNEWLMTPPTVNAYYNPQMNQMVFPAGILQPPFYAPTAGVAVNMGAMGMVVGHELTHGFDDEGSQFDKDGNLKAWWPDAVRDRFKQQTACVSKQYSGYEPLPGVKVNGELTLGENIADMGGVKLAFAAYRKMRESSPTTTVADGFSEDQQFFLSTGQIWCAKYREEYARMAVNVDPHSPPRFRVDGSLANLAEFAQAWACNKGTTMSPENACTVW